MLEIGCGTGLLSFLIEPYVRSLIGVDTSEGMVSAFASKIVDAQAASQAKHENLRQFAPS